MESTSLNSGHSDWLMSRGANSWIPRLKQSKWTQSPCITEGRWDSELPWCEHVLVPPPSLQRVHSVLTWTEAKCKTLGHPLYLGSQGPFPERKWQSGHRWNEGECHYRTRSASLLLWHMFQLLWKSILLDILVLAIHTHAFELSYCHCESHDFLYLQAINTMPLKKEFVWFWL